ncbi:MAG: ABC transporter permease [Anaerolineales bacterium]|nr:ABC transporter permease [Anaerolineales bacterium]
MFARLTEIFRYREAARLLTLRELKVRYSNSTMGIVWSLFHPLLLTVFFSIVFSVAMPSPIANYPIFFLAALLPWNFFNVSVVGSTNTITGNHSLVNRVYFPREILPLAVVAANALNFLVALAPLALLMLVFGVPFTWALLWLPVLILVQFALSSGLALALSALNVYFRDVQQIVEVLMLPWFFLTPIVYSSELITNATVRQLVFVANPMASLVTFYRQAIYFGQTPDFGMLAVAGAEAGLVLVAGLIIFRRASPHFVDEI